MKFVLFILAVATGLACSNNTSPAASDPAVESTSSTANAVAVASETVHPCDAVSGSQVAQALGWAGANAAMPTTMSDGRIQSCYYTATDNVGAATLTVTRSSEKTIERKGLERSFAGDLENENKLRYEEVATGLGHQSIYGTGKRGPSYNYRLQWRKGNEIAYSVDASFYTEKSKEEVLDMLKVLAAKL